MSSLGFWGIIPSVVSIFFAITTKDVLISLMAGIFTGFLFIGIASGHSVLEIFTSSLDLMIGRIMDPWNIRIILFCLLLGGIVGLLNRSGSARVFGTSTSNFLNKRSSVLTFSWCLSLFFFLDDYFSTMGVSAVMRPIANKNRISCAKLSYFVHTMAPNVCVLIPFSSWAVTIMSQMRNVKDFETLGLTEMSFFLKMLPYNFYALISLILLLVVTYLKRDMSPMFKSEERAILENKLLNEDLYGMSSSEIIDSDGNRQVRWYDMPIIILILTLSCFFAFPLSGGFFYDNVLQMFFLESIRQSDASKALVYGVVFTLVFTYVYFLLRRIFTMRAATNAVIEGIKSMVPAVIVLSLAWTIGYIVSKPLEDGGVGLPIFLDQVIRKVSLPLWVIPICLFLVSALISLSSGTSWGTFAIMIPLALPVAIKMGTNAALLQDHFLNFVIISMGAVISGAVLGDHGSPISDTSILSSTGTGCPHLEHVATQLPYTLITAIGSGLAIFIASFLFNPWISLLVGLICTCVLYYIFSKPLSNVVTE